MKRHSLTRTKQVRVESELLEAYFVVLQGDGGNTVPAVNGDRCIVSISVVQVDMVGWICLHHWYGYE